jgi:pimeloyl-ACP methyl ester carboxylesterase
MTRPKRRALLAGLAAIPLLIAAGPFLIPVPPLENTRPARELADADSQFVNINGLDIHVKTIGQGEPVFLLLHGFASSLYSWNQVVEPLSRIGKVIVYDRPAFGLSERPLEWEGQNPYGMQAQVDLAIGLLDYFEVEQAILIGNSAGGAISMQAALEHPERVSELVLVDPAVYSSGGVPSWVRPLLATPQMRHLGPLFVRQIKSRGLKLLEMAWHDPKKLQPEMAELFQKPLEVDNWDKALWEFSLAGQKSNLAEQLDSLTLPVLVITGDDDRIVPTKDSIRLAGELPNARLEVIKEAGHVPHEEQPAAFMAALKNFLNKSQ